MGGTPEFLVQFLTAIKSTLEDPLFLRQFYPGLLNGLAAVIRAFPPEFEDADLGGLLSLYHAASSMPLRAENQDEIDYVNRLYESIFRGLGALIFAARNERAFLAAHRDDWFRPVARCVQRFGLILEPPTLLAYLFFLQNAVDYLPPSCRRALARVYVRVLLICLFAANYEPSRDGPGTLLWDRLCPDEI
jgi:hypothetical protein